MKLACDAAFYLPDGHARHLSHHNSLRPVNWSYYSTGFTTIARRYHRERRQIKDDIGYVHLKEDYLHAVFKGCIQTLTSRYYCIGVIIAYLRAFTDLNEDVIDAEAVHDALEAIEPYGHVTIDAENTS